MPITVTLTDTASPALGEMPARLQADLAQIMDNDVRALYARAAALAGGGAMQPKSGRYLAAIRDAMTASGDRVTGEVAVDDPRAGLFEYGGETSPHDIAPVNGHALAFMGPDAGTLFAAVVHHPGSVFRSEGGVGQHATVRRAAAEMEQQIIQDLEAAGDRIEGEV